MASLISRGVLTSHHSSRTLCGLSLTLLLSAPLQGQAWEKLPIGVPLARFAPAATATANGEALLFGGASSPTSPFGDSYALRGGLWRRFTPPASPTPRHSSDMAFDASRNRAVMFGGYNASVQRLNDTWEFDGTTWTQASTAVAPPIRAFHRLVYDPLRQVVVLFGGGESFRRRLNDTWEWDGATWTRMSPTTSPPVRSGHGMAWSPALRSIVMHGGALGSAASSIKNDTWAYDGVTWRQLDTGPNAPAVTAFDLSTDPVHGGVVFFGGAGPSGEPTGTWRLHPDRGWETFTLPSAPPHRTDHASLTLTTGEIVIVAGGRAFGSALGDSWLFHGDDASAVAFGAGCQPAGPGPILRTNADQLPRVGQPTVLDASGFADTRSAAWLNVSSVGGYSPLDLTALGLPGCFGYVASSGPAASLLAPITSGLASWSLQVPNATNLVGLELINQAVSVDDTGTLATTSGVVLKVGS